MTGFLRQCGSLIRTVAFHAFSFSDTEKWERYDFPSQWEFRLRHISARIPAAAAVFEFGAGPVGLRPYLHPSCTLTSSDLVPRNPGMMTLDLNRRPLPALLGIRTEIAVLAGVLEYVSDVGSVAAWLAKHFVTCIATYETAQSARGLNRMREVIGRTHAGWVNHFSEREFIDLFCNAGFTLLEQTIWGGVDPETVFVFRKADDGIAGRNQDLF
jgi:hypothetical protein